MAVHGLPSSCAMRASRGSEMERAGALVSSVECTHDRLGFLLDHAQQGLCRAFRFTPALLPVLKCLDAHSNHSGKLTLGEAESFTQSLDINCLQNGSAVRELLSAHDRSHLLHALDELLKIFVIHWCMIRLGSSTVWLGLESNPPVGSSGMRKA